MLDDTEEHRVPYSLVTTNKGKIQTRWINF